MKASKALKAYSVGEPVIVIFGPKRRNGRHSEAHGVVVRKKIGRVCGKSAALFDVRIEGDFVPMRLVDETAGRFRGYTVDQLISAR